MLTSKKPNLWNCLTTYGACSVKLCKSAPAVPITANNMPLGLVHSPSFYQLLLGLKHLYHYILLDMFFDFWRVRNIINFIVRNEHDKEVKYIEMVYDDISQLIDFVESYEGTINSRRILYVAKGLLQINDTMRLLTIFTVILLPLTLIAGIYGMNGLDLNNLGELPAGFLIVVISMACIGIGLLVFFIKKQWILVRGQNGSERVHNGRTSEHKNRTNNMDSHISYRVWKSGQ